MKCCNKNKKCGPIKILFICVGAVLALIGLVVVIKKIANKCPVCGKKSCECGNECDCLDEECCCGEDDCCGEEMIEKASETIENATDAIEEKAEDVSEAIRKKADELFD